MICCRCGTSCCGYQPPGHLLLLQPSNRVVSDGWSFPSGAPLPRPVIGKTLFWNNIICCQSPRSQSLFFFKATVSSHQINKTTSEFFLRSQLSPGASCGITLKSRRLDRKRLIGWPIIEEKLGVGLERPKQATTLPDRVNSQGASSKG